MNCDVHGHVTWSSYNSPVLYSYCNSFFIRDVHGEFGLINVHLFDILPVISSRKVSDFRMSGEWKRCVSCCSVELRCVSRQERQTSKCCECSSLNETIARLHSEIEQLKTDAERSRMEAEEWRTQALEAEEWRTQALEAEHAEELEQQRLLVSEERHKIATLQDTVSAKEHLVSELRSQFEAEKLDLEKAIREECLRNESRLVDEVALKCRDEVRQEYESVVAELRSANERILLDRKLLEEQLEAEKSRVSEANSELNELRTESSEWQKSSNEARLVARHIADTYRQVVTSDLTQLPGVDPTQMVVATQFADDATDVRWTDVESVFNELIQILQQVLAESRKSVAEWDDERRREVEVLAEEHRVTLERIGTEHSSQVDTLCKKHSSELDTVHRKHELEFKELRADGERKVSDVTTTLEAELSEMRMQWTSEMDCLRTDNEAAVEKLRSEHNREMESLKEQWQKRFDDTVQQCEHDMAELRLERDARLSAVTEASRKELEDLRDKSRQELEGVRNWYEAEVGELTRERDQNLSEMSEATKKHQEKIDELVATHSAEVEQMKTAWQAEVKEVTERGQLEVSEVKARLDEELSQLKTSYEKKLLELCARMPQQADTGAEMKLSLLVEDYLPVQRHEEIVHQLNTALRTVSGFVSSSYLFINWFND